MKKKSIVDSTFSLTFVFFISIQFCSAQFVNATYENGSTLGKYNIELTEYYTGYTIFNTHQYSGDTRHVFDQFGVHIGVGIFYNFDIYLGYSRILFIDRFSFDLNYLEVAPKFSLTISRTSLYLPFGIFFDQGGERMQFSPALLFTFPSNNQVDLSFSTGAIIPLKESSSTAIRFNLGFGFSTNLQQWAVRPEFGLLFSPIHDGHYISYGIGFNYHFH